MKVCFRLEDDGIFCPGNRPWALTITEGPQMMWQIVVWPRNDRVGVLGEIDCWKREDLS